MIAAGRQKLILELLAVKTPLSIKELTHELNASEATLRRDITYLDKLGKLKKIYGGAMRRSEYLTADDNLELREKQNMSAKEKIAALAATLIKPHSIVYIDAGSTTGTLIRHLSEKRATYFTNCLPHALALRKKNFNSILIGGVVKTSTYACIGAMAMAELQRYNFTLGFFGANGIDKRAGFSTPTPEEAIVKELALKHSQKAYVLADHTKFGKIAASSFASLNDATIITDICPDGYENCQFYFPTISKR